jgi:hypothetical protein
MFERIGHRSPLVIEPRHEHWPNYSHIVVWQFYRQSGFAVR